MESHRTYFVRQALYFFKYQVYLLKTELKLRKGLISEWSTISYGRTRIFSLWLCLSIVYYSIAKLTNSPFSVQSVSIMSSKWNGYDFKINKDIFNLIVLEFYDHKRNGRWMFNFFSFFAYLIMVGRVHRLTFFNRRTDSGKLVELTFWLSITTWNYQAKYYCQNFAILRNV